MEDYNSGKMAPFKKPNIPTFHHSRFLRTLLPANPLFMITHARLGNQFLARVI